MVGFELMIPVMTFLAVTAIGGAVIAARTARRERLQERLQSGGVVDADLESETRSWLIDLMVRIGKACSFGQVSQNLKTELARAGLYSSSAPLIYLGAKIVLLTAGVAGLSLLVLPLERFSPLVRLLIILWGAAALFFVPNMVVRRKRLQRSREVRGHLPDALDLLEVCVSSGMGLDLAWKAVTEQIRPVSPVLADEMAITDFEMHLNAPRATAMRHMAERTDADEIAALTAVLVQSDRFGTSVSEALRTFSASMREIRSQQAEEAAEKMTVKLLFPMILLIFPAVLTVICGPAVIRWIHIIYD